MEEEQQLHQSHVSSDISNIQKSEDLHVIRRVKRRTCITLPDDMMYYNILIRLPAKILVRCRMVCKSWKRGISTPEFVKAHFTRQQCVKDQDLLIGHKVCSTGHGVIIISRSTEIPVTVGPLRTQILLGSINGLVCMASETGGRSGTDFSVWNPATGQAKEINLPYHDPQQFNHLLGFSWDHVRDDYKAVIVCRIQMSSLRYLYIYSCRSASWTRQILPKNKLGYSSNMAPSTIVKGLPYWSFTKYRKECMHAYIYVFTKDELRSLPCLDLDYSIKIKNFNLVHLKDSLVGMVSCSSNNQDNLVDMYSLDKESDTGVWSKMRTIAPLDLLNRGWQLSQCFMKGGEILIVKGGKLGFYDPKTIETKFIRSTHHSLRLCYSYTPSLVCVEGMESMIVLPFQETELKNLATKYSNLVTSSGLSTSDSSSSSEYSSSDDSGSDADSGSESDAETSGSDYDA